jgi:hypothetical protein
MSRMISSPNDAITLASTLDNPLSLTGTGTAVGCCARSTNTPYAPAQVGRQIWTIENFGLISANVGYGIQNVWHAR